MHGILLLVHGGRHQVPWHGVCLNYKRGDMAIHRGGPCVIYTPLQAWCMLWFLWSRKLKEVRVELEVVPEAMKVIDLLKG